MNCKTLPKAELHCHLEACFRPTSVLEVGRTLGLDIPEDPVVFHRDWLLSRPLENLQLALGRFVDIQRIWSSAEVIERLTFEARRVRTLQPAWRPGELHSRGRQAACLAGDVLAGQVRIPGRRPV